MKFLASLLFFTSLGQGQYFYLPKKIDKKGQTLVTNQIQNELDKISKNNGGTLYIEAGKYLTGSLFPGKNTTIFLETGAEIIASTNIKDYKGNHFIHAINADNFTLKGNGIINGSGSSFYDKDYKPLTRPEPWIVIENSSNVSISDLKLINSPAHVLVFDNCNIVYVNNIKIENDLLSPNTDGIDIVGTSNVTITNCYFKTGDDAICLKSKKDMDNKFAESTQNKGIENVLVSNCIIESDDAGIKLGTGSEYVTRNCIFKNNIIKNTRYGIALFMMDGGLYENIIFSDIIIETGGRHDNVYPIFVDIHLRKENSKFGTIKGIAFNNLTIRTEGNLYFSGVSSSKLDDISLNNVAILVTKARNTSKWVKPKGNKAIKQWSNCTDFTKENATVIIANATNVKLNNVEVVQQAGDQNKFAFGFINSSIAKNSISGNSINQKELYFNTNSQVEK
jgi:polygalacturonase